jgi:hypothetical protein
LSPLSCYVISSTKLVIRAEQNLPGPEEGRRGKVKEGGRVEK